MKKKIKKERYFQTKILLQIHDNRRLDIFLAKDVKMMKSMIVQRAIVIQIVNR